MFSKWFRLIVVLVLVCFGTNTLFSNAAFAAGHQVSVPNRYFGVKPFVRYISLFSSKREVISVKEPTRVPGFLHGIPDVDVPVVADGLQMVLRQIQDKKRIHYYGDRDFGVFDRARALFLRYKAKRRFTNLNTQIAADLVQRLKRVYNPELAKEEFVSGDSEKVYKPVSLKEAENALLEMAFLGHRFFSCLALENLQATQAAKIKKMVAYLAFKDSEKVIRKAAQKSLLVMEGAQASAEKKVEAINQNQVSRLIKARRFMDELVVKAQNEVERRSGIDNLVSLGAGADRIVLSGLRSKNKRQVMASLEVVDQLLRGPWSKSGNKAEGMTKIRAADYLSELQSVIAEKDIFCAAKAFRILKAHRSHLSVTQDFSLIAASFVKKVSLRFANSRYRHENRQILKLLKNIKASVSKENASVLSLFQGVLDKRLDLNVKRWEVSSLSSSQTSLDIRFFIALAALVFALLFSAKTGASQELSNTYNNSVVGVGLIKVLSIAGLIFASFKGLKAFFGVKEKSSEGKFAMVDKVLTLSFVSGVLVTFAGFWNPLCFTTGGTVAVVSFFLMSLRADPWIVSDYHYIVGGKSPAKDTRVSLFESMSAEGRISFFREICKESDVSSRLLWELICRVDDNNIKAYSECIAELPINVRDELVDIFRAIPRDVLAESPASLKYVILIEGLKASHYGLIYVRLCSYVWTQKEDGNYVLLERADVGRVRNVAYLLFRLGGKKSLEALDALSISSSASAMAASEYYTELRRQMAIPEDTDEDTTEEFDERNSRLSIKDDVSSFSTEKCSERLSFAIETLSAFADSSFLTDNVSFKPELKVFAKYLPEQKDAAHQIEMHPVAAGNDIVMLGELVHELVHRAFDLGLIGLPQSLSGKRREYVEEVVASVVQSRVMLSECRLQEKLNKVRRGTAFDQMFDYLKKNAAVDPLSYRLMSRFVDVRASQLHKQVYMTKKLTSLSFAGEKGALSVNELSDLVQQIETQYLPGRNIEEEVEAYKEDFLRESLSKMKTGVDAAGSSVVLLDNPKEVDVLMINRVVQNDRKVYILNEGVLSVFSTEYPSGSECLDNVSIDQAVDHIQVSERNTGLTVISDNNARLLDDLPKNKSILRVSTESAAKFFEKGNESADMAALAFSCGLDENDVESMTGLNKPFIIDDDSLLIELNTVFFASFGSTVKEGIKNIYNRIREALAVTVKQRVLESAA